jgi:putative copper export protein
MNQVDQHPDFPNGRSLVVKMAIVAIMVVVAGAGFLWHSSRAARSEAPMTVPIKWSTMPLPAAEGQQLP